MCHELRGTNHQSPITSHQSPPLERQRPICALELRQGNHINRIPRATLEKRAIRPFAGAEFASDAQQGIDDDATERGMVLVRRPIHALGHRTVFNAGGRSRAPRAAFIDYCKYVRLTLALSRRSGGNRRLLDDCSRLKFFNGWSRITHVALHEKVAPEIKLILAKTIPVVIPLKTKNFQQ